MYSSQAADRKSPAADAGQRIAFLEFDFAAGILELRREGRPVALRAQPSRVLALLVERPNQLVTRDEIISNVWGDTCVDYDQGINNAIRQLRAALDDDAKHPRCIETVPKIGYRFIAPIRSAGNEASAEQRPPGERRLIPVMALVASIAALLLASAVLLRDTEATTGQLTSTRVADPDPLLVVVPFEPVGMGGEQIHIASGVAHELVRELIDDPPAVTVVGHTSVSALLARGLEPMEVARRLGATHLLTGSIRREGERLRLGVELLETDDGTTSWTSSYDAVLGDLLKVERTLAEQIAMEIGPHFVPDRAVSPAGEIDSQAMDDYLRGRYLILEGTPEATGQAVLLLQSVVEREPHFAEALVALAEGALMAPATAESISAARESVERALTVDPVNARAHLVRSRIALVHEWNWELSRRHIETAIRLAPGDPLVHLGRATWLSTLARHQEARQEVEEALRLDPISATLQGDVAFLHHLAGRSQEALASAEFLLELQPDSSFGQSLRIESLLELDRHEEARDAALALYRHLSEESPEERQAIEDLQNASGEAIERAWLSLASVRWDRRPSDSNRDVVLATIHARLGSPDEALARLESAVRSRSAYAPFIAVDPHFSTLRSERRFQRLLGSISDQLPAHPS